MPTELINKPAVLVAYLDRANAKTPITTQADVVEVNDGDTARFCLSLSSSFNGSTHPRSTDPNISHSIRTTTTSA
jgi:hypothetical protein